MTPDRRSRLIQNIDLRTAKGLEIGPLAWPLIRKAEGDITYLDHAATEDLRKKYATNAGVPVDQIVEVDCVWGAQTLPEAVGGRHFDYVLASHVVEHVPDLIGWFNEVLDVLSPGGEIRLAVPDRRYTFDYHRRETQIVDVLAAHAVKARVPQPQQIIDFFVHFAAISTDAAWLGHVPRLPEWTLASCNAWMDAARRAMEGEYQDVHCWVFTPRSWARLMGDLVRSGLLACECAFWWDTERDTNEFIVSMRRGADPSGWDRMACEARHHDTESQLRAELAALRGSTSWRLSAPLRWLVDKARGN